jgi:hypothetical protein
MKQSKFWLLSLTGLILSGVLGFGIYRWVQPRMAGPACGYSQAAKLALDTTNDAAAQKQIQAADAAFGTEFAAVCGQLCSQRAKLSEKLITAKADDPEVNAALDAIHRQQAQMEKITWKHIITVRDLLPEAQRGKYIRKVQDNWADGQARLRNAASLSQCQMEHGKPKTEK